MATNPIYKMNKNCKHEFGSSSTEQQKKNSCRLLMWLQCVCVCVVSGGISFVSEFLHLRMWNNIFFSSFFVDCVDTYAPVSIAKLNKYNQCRNKTKPKKSIFVICAIVSRNINICSAGDNRQTIR